MRSSLLLLLTALLSVADSSRILAVLPINSKSHSIFFYSILRLLALRGHQVLVYSPFEPPTPIDNVTHINLHFEFLEEITNLPYDEFSKFFQETFFGITALDMFDWGRRLSEGTLKDEKIKNLLNSDEQFDLVVLEAILSQEALLVFGHRFKAPVVNLQGFGTWNVLNWVTGNSLSISYLPDCLSFSFTDRMSFTERFRNLVSTVGTLLNYHFIHLPKNQELIERHYGVPGTPPVEEMIKNISLTLTNDVATIEYPRPYTPNLVPVGGVHMSIHMSSLPKDIKKFMDEAKEGVIYFSLGTFVPDHLLPQEIIVAFVNTFKKLKKKVLWKIKLDTIPGLPNNVMLAKWVPQPSVLAHPNCHLFITHGGLFSQHEAFFAGKPVIAVPFITEQKFNVGFYKHLGVGIELDLSSLTEDTVTAAIHTVLDNTSYKQRADEVSRIFRDQEVSAADKTVFWVEYVMRHRGAHHLRPTSATLPWYQLALLDILAVILVTAVVIVFILYKLVKVLIILMLSKNSNSLGIKKKIN